MKGLPYIKTGIYVVVVALFICLLFLMRSQVEHQPIISNLSMLQDAHVEIERSIPQQIYPCLISQADWVSLFQKRESIKAIKVLGQAKSEKTSFYYLNFETNLNSNWGTVPNSFQALVKLDKQRKCTRLYSELEKMVVTILFQKKRAALCRVTRWHHG